MAESASDTLSPEEAKSLRSENESLRAAFSALTNRVKVMESDLRNTHVALVASLDAVIVLVSAAQQSAAVTSAVVKDEAVLKLIQWRANARAVEEQKSRDAQPGERPSST